MSLIGLEHEWVHVDILNQETHSEAFKAMNPNAKIPVLKVSDENYLWESNAILNFLAEGTSWLPDSDLERARVLQWQFFEQYSHEPYIAVARFIRKYLGLPDDRLDEYRSKQTGGHKALSVMELQLTETDYLCGNLPSIADISLYAYTHVAEEGGFSLEKYTAINAWLNRIEKLPGYIAQQ
jgi:glutathione S-transferase